MYSKMLKLFFHQHDKYSISSDILNPVNQKKRSKLLGEHAARFRQTHLGREEFKALQLRRRSRTVTTKDSTDESSKWNKV